MLRYTYAEMADHAFLSPRRSEIVAGETSTEMGITDGTYRNHRAETKRQARQALSELIEVAESDTIDNIDVFEPSEVARLIAAIFSPPSKTITPRWNFDGTDAEYREKYGFETALCWRLEHLIDGYSDTLLRELKPGESPASVNLIEDED